MKYGLNLLLWAANRGSAPRIPLVGFLGRFEAAMKPRIVRALAEEQVAWRTDAMRPQLAARGAVPLLLARPSAPWAAGRCCSCGDPLAAADRYRCRPCGLAAAAVLAELG